LTLLKETIVTLLKAVIDRPRRIYFILFDVIFFNISHENELSKGGGFVLPSVFAVNQ
jgi:hypothetical protein